jgi:FG-GAP-like repeat/Abnormal spindle-like microcephaly-assoc'd, ASPM-SPD-2-Hydin
MKFPGLSLLFVLFACTAAWAQSNPLPFVNQPLAPSSTPPGGPSFTLTVHGSGFVSGATVNWNGSALASSFVSVDELTATVSASDIAIATSAAITVTNPTPGGGNSNVVYFAVSAPTTLQFTTSPANTSLPSGQQAISNELIAADFNRDGKLDLSIGTVESPLLAPHTSDDWIALGNGDGTFQGPTQAFRLTQSGELMPAAGDFNGDGTPDLVETDYFDFDGYSETCHVRVFLGNGDGTFSQSSEGITQQTNFTFGPPLVGDFNGDGKLDVAVPTFGGLTEAGVLMFLGNGDGTLQSGLLSNVSDLQVLGAVGDFDGDGKLDLIGITGTTNTQLMLGFFHGNGDGTFTSPSTLYSIGPNTGMILAADLNGDGKLDLITIQFAATNTFTVMLGNGDGTFQSGVVYPVGTSLIGGVLGDFSADGKLDLVLALSNGTNTLIVPGDGDGTFNLTNTLTLPAAFLASGDFNSDGKLDLLAATPGSIPEVVCLLQEAPLAGLSPSGVTFSAQALGTTSSPQSVTLTNNGTGPLNLSNAAITGTNSGDFPQTNNCPSTLAVGASCQINIRFAPTATGPRSGSLALTDNAPGTPQTIPLSGSGGLAAVQLSASTLNFANEPVGNTSASQSISVSNTGYSTLNISSITVTGANAGDFSETLGCGSTLAAGASCTVSVKFIPTAIGSRNAAVTISDDAPGSPQTITLTGSGITTVGLSPSSVTFSGQYVGTSGLPQSVTVTNNGAAPLIISAIATSPSDFGTLSACGNSVAPGASCAIGVFFDPTQAGTRTGTLTVTDNAVGSTQTVALTGIGQDFSVAASSSMATVTSGQTANYTIAIAPVGGFNKTVALSCSGAPASSTCSLSSSSIPLNGSTPTSITVAVATGVSSMSMVTPFGLPPISNVTTFWISFVGLATLAPLWILGRSRKRPLWLLRGLAFASLFLLVTLLSSCSSGAGGHNGTGGTPAGTYNLTVTGTFNSGSATLAHATNLTLVVK